MEQKRSYTILATALVIINGLIVAVIAFLYITRPIMLQGLVEVEIIGGFALATLLYFFSIHNFLRAFHQGLSTLIMTIIMTANLVLVIDQTGGLDSPFYSLWLLAIVTSGIFGQVYTLAILGLTLAVHIADFAQHGFRPLYIQKHAIGLIFPFLAAAIAEWVYYRGTITGKRAMASLSGQLSEEQLKAQALMSSMADGVIVVDQDRQVQLINTAAQNMTGWDEVSAKNIDYRIILKLKDSQEKDITDQEDPFLQSWAMKAGVVHNDLVCYTRSGKRIALSISVSPIYNANQQITGGIAVFRDISKEKEIERTRNEFVSTASHEMRTPVAAIEGYIALAMNSKVATIDDRAQSYLTKAHDNTQHLGALFRDLLSVTKLDEGLIARNLAPVNLTKLLQDITNDMQFAAAKKNLSITFMSQNTLGMKMVVPNYWVLVDPERMREVIMNLIENGMKFTQEGGITLSIKGDTKAVSVFVQDTGIGIPKEDMVHLFQKFYRVDNSATRTIGGTGLGLYLCRTLIELFNGRIWVESEFGKGSSFNFTLPRIAAPAQEPADTVAGKAQPNAAPAQVPSPTPAPTLIPIAVPTEQPTPQPVTQPQTSMAAASGPALDITAPQPVTPQAPTVTPAKPAVPVSVPVTAVQS